MKNRTGTKFIFSKRKKSERERELNLRCELKKCSLNGTGFVNAFQRIL